MEAIKFYVQGAFQGVKPTPEVIEQQEEIIADLTAKVNDLVAEGKSQDEALGVAIASLGDLSPLVAEFADRETPDAPPVATLYSTHLDLHVIAISAGIGAAVMIASTAMGAWTELVHPAAALSLLAVLGAGIWWIRAAYLRYEAAPDAIETRALEYKKRYRQALGVWAIVVIGSTMLNSLTGYYFWCWPFWVAGGTWALTVKVEERLVAGGGFAAKLSDIADSARTPA